VKRSGRRACLCVDLPIASDSATDNAELGSSISQGLTNRLSVPCELDLHLQDELVFMMCLAAARKRLPHSVGLIRSACCARPLQAHSSLLMSKQQLSVLVGVEQRMQASCTWEKHAASHRSLEVCSSSFLQRSQMWVCCWIQRALSSWSFMPKWPARPWNWLLLRSFPVGGSLWPACPGGVARVSSNTD